jgi:acetyltransferase-like isoleucine patch superfamily enzyme
MPAPEDHSTVAREASAGRGSAIRAYQDLVVGSRSWLRLLQHEAISCWGAVLPGAAGLVFRKLLWPGLVASAGHGVFWGRNITLRHSWKMQIGDGVVIDDGCQLDAQGCTQGAFRIDDGALISRGCIVSGKDGPLTIGARANIGAGCVLYASTGLEIGADTMLAALCYVGGGRYATRGPLDVPLSEQQEPRSGVSIGSDCWIGAGAVIIDGVRLGHGSIVGAGAVVTRSFEPYSVIAGVPARPIANRGNINSKEKSG